MNLRRYSVGTALRWPRFARRPGSVFRPPTGPCPGLGYADQGVRLAFVDLRALRAGRVPQVAARPSHANHAPYPNQGQHLKNILTHWVNAGLAGVKAGRCTLTISKPMF